MTTTEIEEHLASKDVRPTANRILVFKPRHDLHRPMSLKGLESRLLYMDKSSIFRVLSLFLEHDVVHTFEDGRGHLNYELCEHHGPCNHDENHVHFYCESCQRSFCLENVHVPEVQLPEGFEACSVSFVVKGVCAECILKKKKRGLTTYLESR